MHQVHMIPSKAELPPLETPLDYPACLERITEAAVLRAEYEINMTKLLTLFLKDRIAYTSEQNRFLADLFLITGKTIQDSCINWRHL